MRKFLILMFCTLMLQILSPNALASEYFFDFEVPHIYFYDNFTNLTLGPVDGWARVEDGKLIFHDTETVRKVDIKVSHTLDTPYISGTVIFEFDYMPIEHGIFTYQGFPKFYDSVGNYQAMMNFYKGGQLSKSLDEQVFSFTNGETYRLKLVLDLDRKLCDAYVDDRWVYQKEYNLVDFSAYDFCQWAENSTKTTVAIDNLKIYPDVDYIRVNSEKSINEAFSEYMSLGWEERAKTQLVIESGEYDIGKNNFGDVDLLSPLKKVVLYPERNAEIVLSDGGVSVPELSTLSVPAKLKTEFLQAVSKRYPDRVYQANYDMTYDFVRSDTGIDIALDIINRSDRNREILAISVVRDETTGYLDTKFTKITVPSQKVSNYDFKHNIKATTDNTYAEIYLWEDSESLQPLKRKIVYSFKQDRVVSGVKNPYVPLTLDNLSSKILNVKLDDVISYGNFKISGTTDKCRGVSLVLLDSDEKISYLNQAVCDSNGNFEMLCKMATMPEGIFTLRISSY